MITLPVNMSLQDWADQIVLDLDSYGPISRLDTDDWQRWGVQFIVNSSLGRYNIPNPYQFDDWQTWADRFCEVQLS